MASVTFWTETGGGVVDTVTATLAGLLVAGGAVSIRPIRRHVVLERVGTRISGVRRVVNVPVDALKLLTVPWLGWDASEYVRGTVTLVSG